MQLEGYLDGRNPHLLAGWVRDVDAPEHRLTVEARLGNVPLASGLADRFRGDLLAAGKGDGRHAFALPLPAPLNPIEAGLLNLRIPGSTRLFLAGDTHLLRHDLPPIPPAGRRFRRCILHIGTEKTGTVTLQTFLAANRDGLAAQGIFQPQTLIWPRGSQECGSQALAAFALRDEALQHPVRTAEGVTDPASLHGWRSRLAQEFAAELAAAPPQCDTLLLSSEHCHSNLALIHEVQAVRHLLDPFCDSYEIVVYLRAQHELAASVYGMFLRDGHHDAVMLPDFSQPRPPGKALFHAYLDYESLLARWAWVFGRDSLRVRLYTRDALRNGNILDDFTTHFLPPGEWWQPNRRNTNQSAGAQHLLIRLGRALARRPPADATRVNAWLLPRLRTHAQGHGIQPTRAEVARFMQHFAAANARVRDAWFPGRPALFDVELSRFPPAASNADEDAAAAMDALIDLLLADPPA